MVLHYNSKHLGDLRGHKIAVWGQTGGQRIEVLSPRTHLGDNGGPRRARGAQSESKESPGYPKREPGGAQEAPREFE